MPSIDTTFATRNLRGSLGRYRVLLGFMAGAAAFLLLLSGVVGQGAAALAGKLSKNSAVSSIVVSSQAPGSPRALDKAGLAALQSIPHVVSVAPWAQEGMMSNDSGLWQSAHDPSVFWATPRIAFAQPKVVATVAGHDPGLPTLGADEVILPATINGRSMNSELGRTVDFEYTLATGASDGIGEHVKLRVVGLFDNSVPGSDGPNPVYVSPELEHRMIAAMQGLRGVADPGSSYSYPSAYVNVDDVAHVTAVQSQISKAGFSVSSIAGQVTELPGLLGLLSKLNLAIAGMLAVFCLGSGISIGSAWLAQRSREIGLLRALGWTRGRIFRALIGEILAAGLVCGAFGAALGVGSLLVASRLLASRSLLEIEFSATTTLPAWYWFAGILFGLPIALAVGAVRPLLRLSRIAPDDALRQL